jgi:ABC-type Fe3+-hydroxamate transport system substrate-binding protein
MATSRRLVSLSPNVSLILFALGTDVGVVGCTQHCLPAIQQYLKVWHIPEHTVAQRLQHWAAVPVVAVWPLADCEPIKALRPELILTSGSGPFGVHEAQRFGVAPGALFHFDTRTFADLDQHIVQIGTLLGKAAEAARLIEQVAMKCDEIKAQQSGRSTTPAVLFEYCVCTTYDADPERRVASPAHTILVGGHLAPELIQLGGGEPVLVKPGDTAKWVVFDDIRQVRPDVILQFDCHGCPTAQRHPIQARHGWSELPAVDRQAVYPLSANISDPNLCFPVALAQVVDALNTYAARMA